MNRKLNILSITFIALLITVIMPVWVVVVYLNPPDLKEPRQTPETYSLEHQDVSFETEDGVTLQGWYLSKEEDAPAIILVHGWPADKSNMLPMAHVLHEEGYSVLLFDTRGLGESGGDMSTLGIEEPKDVKAAVSFLTDMEVTDIGIWGISMGAAATLQAAPYEDEVKVVIAEASYSNLADMASEMFSIPLLKHFLGYMTESWAYIITGLSLRDADIEEAVRDIDIPILLVHSRHDDVIPFHHAKTLQDALAHNDNAVFWFPGNKGHGQLSQDYAEVVLRLLDKKVDRGSN